MSERDTALAMILGDLDRCAHGRHWGDRCSGYDPQRPRSGCPGGTSLGNPLLRPGTPIGYSITGEVYVLPDRPYTTYNPAAWRTSSGEMPDGFTHPDDNPDRRPRAADWPQVGDLLGPATTTIPDHVIGVVTSDGARWERAAGDNRRPDGPDGEEYDWVLPPSDTGTWCGYATTDGLLDYTPLRVTRTTP